PIVAVEAARRTVAHALKTLCSSPGSPAVSTLVRQASEALRQVQAFLSKVTEPLPSEDEQRWFIETLHALDHTIRLAETIGEGLKVDASLDGPDERRAAQLHTDARRTAAASSALLEHITVEHTAPGEAESGKAVEYLASCSGDLARLRREHRRTTLDSVASR